MSRIQVIFSLSAVIFLCLPLISASADASTSDQVAQVLPDILGLPNLPANIAFETWRIDSGMDTLQNYRAQVANSQEAANDINDIFLKARRPLEPRTEHGLPVVAHGIRATDAWAFSHSNGLLS